MFVFQFFRKQNPSFADTTCTDLIDKKISSAKMTKTNKMLLDIAQPKDTFLFAFKLYIDKYAMHSCNIVAKQHKKRLMFVKEKTIEGAELGASVKCALCSFNVCLCCICKKIRKNINVVLTSGIFVFELVQSMFDECVYVWCLRNVLSLFFLNIYL